MHLYSKKSRRTLSLLDNYNASTMSILARGYNGVKSCLTELRLKLENFLI